MEPFNSTDDVVRRDDRVNKEETYRDSSYNGYEVQIMYLERVYSCVSIGAYFHKSIVCKTCSKTSDKTSYNRAYIRNCWNTMSFSTLGDIEVLSVLGDGIVLHFCRNRHNAHTISVNPGSDYHGY